MRILKDALLQELREKPYQRVSIASICRRAEIPRRSFYRYFHSKRDCLLAVIEEYLAASWKTAENHDLQQCLMYWKDHRDFLHLLKTNDLYPVFLEQAVLFVQKQNRRNWDEYQIRFVVTGVLYAIVYWIESGCKATVADLESKLQNLLAVPLLKQVANDA